MFKIAFKSLQNRRLTVALSVLTVALSVLLLIGVERLRTEARNSFSNTVSGTDLIVGARTGSVQLLLYSVFRVGNATNNIGWDSYQKLAKDERVEWTIPVSLGDSHKGFPVLGTSTDYFKHLKFGEDQHLQLAQGKIFARTHDTVLGANVAKKSGYALGSKIVLTHGSGEGAMSEHADQPFTITGILAPTGTPVDDTVHVSLDGLTAIHEGWESGSASLLSTSGVLAADENRAVPPPATITAFYVGLKSRTSLFSYQRAVNQYHDETLMAIMPGVALSELWQLMKIAEQALLVVSGFVMIIGLLGMLTALLTGLNERRREMAILRSVGARAWQIFVLVMGETLLLVSVGIAAGVGLLYLIILACRPVLREFYGMSIAINPPTSAELLMLLATLIAGALIGAIPAWRAYRMSLSDGLSQQS
ncbi:MULTISPECIES: ABC transporter permease [unclassified Iodobacter]|uniref:ABC transporter permease n=1 Tax=unclassified Iodobacter TaxID=235634 RepID=UPI0025D6C699|nr:MULTISPECIES: ABC transporter permease [unclassified Iodobacter]MDW5417064.1 ABC transporter permease [Iodobacter sp. CM08]